MILQQNCKPKPRLDTQYLGLQDHFSSKGWSFQSVPQYLENMPVMYQSLIYLKIGSVLGSSS